MYGLKFRISNGNRVGTKFRQILKIIPLLFIALYANQASAMELCDSSLNRYGLDGIEDPVGFTHPIFSEPRWRCKQVTIGLSDFSFNTTHKTELTSFDSASNECQQITLNGIYDSEGPIVQQVINTHESNVQSILDDGTLIEEGLDIEACFISTGGAAPDDEDLGDDLRKIGGHSVSFAPHLYRYLSGTYDNGGSLEYASLSKWDVDTKNGTQYPSATVEYVPPVEQSRCFDPLCEPGLTAANQYSHSPIEPGLGTFDFEMALFPSQFPGLVPISLFYSSHAARVQHEDSYQSLVGNTVLGWHLSYDKTLQLDNRGPGLVTSSPVSTPKNIYIITPTDDRLIFNKTNSGNWQNVSHPGVRAIIEKVSADTYEVSRPDGYLERYTVVGTRGKLNFIHYPDGREITITRSTTIGNEYYTLEQNHPVASTKVHTVYGAPVRIESLANPDYAFDFNYTPDYLLESIRRPDGSQLSFTQHRDSADMPDEPTVSNLPTPFLDTVSLNGVELLGINYDTLGRATNIDSVSGANYSVAYNGSDTTTINGPLSAEYSLLSTPLTVETTDYWGDLDIINVINVSCSACGFTQATEYQEGGVISSQTRSGEQPYNATFNVGGLVDSVSLDSSKQRNFTWNTEQQQLTEITGTDLITTRLAYTDGLITSTTFDGGDASRTIDTPRVNGQVTQISGVGSNVVSIDYNAQGFVNEVTDGTGRRFTMSEHNHLGQPQRITDPNGSVTNATYDIMGRVLNVMRDGEDRLSAAYTPEGQPETVTIDDEAFNYSYDSAFRLSGISGADGQQLDVDYLANGLLDRSTHSHNGVSRSTSFDYNAEGSVTQTNHTFGNGSLQRMYNSRGQVTQETDGTNATSYHYDSNAYLTSVTDKGEQTQLQRDTMGRLTSLTTDGGHQTTFSYTGLGEQTQQLNSNWGYRNYAYGSTGLLTTETTPLRSNSYDYTASDEVLSRTAQHNDTSIPTITTHYGYDDDSDSASGKNYGVGRLTSIENGYAAYEYRYNRQGTLASMAISIDESGNPDPVALSNPDGHIEYRYDEHNQLSGLTYPNGDQIEYVRDPISRKVTHLSRNTILVAQFAHASQLQPATRIEFGNQIVTARQFDDHDRVTGITTGVDLWQQAYTYNIAQNLESIVTTSNLDVGGSQSFGYNVRNQLRGATGDYGRIVYRYDDNNNHTRLIENGVLTFYQYQTGSSQLVSINDINGVVLRALSYDANGNTTQDGARTLHYDAEGRLDIVFEGGVEIASYMYDPYGRRVSKKTSSGDLYFRYRENGQLLEEVDAAGALVRQYIYSEEGELITIYVAALDQLLAVHNDFLGAPVFLTDSNQNVVWSAKRKPFGETEVTVNTVEFPLRASNQYFDQETGYHYNEQRYYNPVTARYLRNDPIGLEGGHNTYDFALKNPLKYVDLDGRESGFAFRLDQRVRDYSNGKITTKEYLDSNFAEGVGGSIGGALVVSWFLAPEVLLLLSTRAPTLTAVATDITAAEIGMTTGGVALAAKGGGEVFDLALGLGRHAGSGSQLLRNFAKNTGSKTYGDIYGYLPVQNNIFNAIKDAKSINFNLDQFSLSRFKSFLSNPKYGDDNITNWELHTILKNPSFLNKTTFYGPGGVKVTAPVID